jgi:hypothetical protein
MVVRTTNVTFRAGHPSLSCAATARAGTVCCSLAPGHEGHHEAAVRVKRPTGSVVGYRFAWLS